MSARSYFPAAATEMQYLLCPIYLIHIICILKKPGSAERVLIALKTIHEFKLTSSTRSSNVKMSSKKRSGETSQKKSSPFDVTVTSKFLGDSATRNLLNSGTSKLILDTNLSSFKL